MNFYEILQIPVDADERTIRSAFRRLVREHHPDTCGGASADNFRHIVEAYETLSVPTRRKQYDEAQSRCHRRDANPITSEHVVSVESMAGHRSPSFWQCSSPFTADDQVSHLFRLIDEVFRAFESDLFCYR